MSEVPNFQEIRCVWLTLTQRLRLHYGYGKWFPFSEIAVNTNLGNGHAYNYILAHNRQKKKVYYCRDLCCNLFEANPPKEKENPEMETKCSCNKASLGAQIRIKDSAWVRDSCLELVVCLQCVSPERERIGVCLYVGVCLSPSPGPFNSLS